MATEPLLGYELLTMGGGQLMALTLQMAVQCKAQNLLRNCQTNGWMDEWWYSSRTMWFFAYPIYLFNSIYFFSILMHFLNSLAVRGSIPRTPLLLKAVARSYHLWRRLASKHVATGRQLSQWTEEMSEEGKRPRWLWRCNVWSWTIKPSLGSLSPSNYVFLTSPALKEGRVPERLANFLSMAEKGRQALCTKKIQETHNSLNYHWRDNVLAGKRRHHQRHWALSYPFFLEVGRVDGHHLLRSNDVLSSLQAAAHLGSGTYIRIYWQPLIARDRSSWGLHRQHLYVHIS